MISLLLTARQDSKYLAKFLTTFIRHTKNPDNVELVIFLSPLDTWNKELLDCISLNWKDRPQITLVADVTGKGRGNTQLFYQEAAKNAKGDWLWYLCDDHYLFDGYDEYLNNYINENHLRSDKINVIAPMCANSGRISHILSRKTYETIGFGKHGNVDSYINETLENLDVLMGSVTQPQIPPKPVMFDFSLDKDLMKPKNNPDFKEEEQINLFKSEPMKEKMREDARKLYDVIKEDYAS